MSWTSFRKRRLPLNLALTLILWLLFDQIEAITKICI
jgi:hypothetical protein